MAARKQCAVRPKPNATTGFPVSRYIHLNVGGVLYTTSQETLTRYQDSMLGYMFTQEKIPLAMDDQGRFIIDRDGTLFRYVLNYLRDGRLELPEGFNEYGQLTAEAEFYQLSDLYEAFSCHLNVMGVPYTATRNVLTRCKDGQLHLPRVFRKFNKLEEEAKHFRIPAMITALNIGLNVGGTCFNTTRGVLTSYSGSLLEEWFSQTPVPLEVDRMGRYIIERDGQIFGYILKMIKNNIGTSFNFRNAPLQHVDPRRIEEELLYFKLNSLASKVPMGFRFPMGR